MTARLVPLIGFRDCLEIIPGVYSHMFDRNVKFHNVNAAPTLALGSIILKTINTLVSMIGNNIHTH